MMLSIKGEGQAGVSDPPKAVETCPPTTLSLSSWLLPQRVRHQSQTPTGGHRVCALTDRGERMTQTVRVKSGASNPDLQPPPTFQGGSLYIYENHNSRKRGIKVDVK